MKRAAILLITLLAGCDLYTHGGDDVCTTNGYGADAPAYQQRDPSTGICTYYGGGGGNCTYDSNGCCQYYETPVAVPAPGSYCSGACEGLDENTCSTTYGCHAAYEETGPYPDVVDSSGSQTQFAGCWDIQPLNPIEGGDCTQLDAWTCAQHDDCVSIFGGVAAAGDQAGYGYFAQCAAETPTDACAGIDCGVGATCETQCYPCDPTDGSNGCMSGCGAVCVPDQTCDNVDCGPGYTCAETCDSSSGQCFPSCYPSGPTNPGSCTGDITCQSSPVPACPANTVPGIENGCYTGFCIPTSACGPADPGSCDASGVTCASAPPACPATTVPGVTNGCWSGFCIPTSTCPVPACETVTDESTCQSRSDCEPVYDGQGCTCTPDGSCTCQSESFARCETLVFASGSGSPTGI